MTKPLRIGIVAGEISGDILGAGFIKAVKAKYPDAEFIGVAGPRMQAEGCEALFDMEELAVMGIVEVLGRLPRLFKVKAELVKYFSDNPPDVFVGIDAPDFNLRLEKDLKESGIKTVHYVSPSVWAWRQKRIFKIEAATNLVLAFLPFEKAFYDKFNVPCEFVGHTMADAIPLQTDQGAAQTLLGLDSDKRWLAVLPGSRGSEMEMLAPPFIETCKKLKAKHPDLGFVVALVNQKRRAQFEQAWQQTAPDLDFVLVDDTARNVMIASDAVLLASGTVALECMLVKRPMVVGYKVKPLTAWLAKKMLKTKYVSLPNILADEELVTELLQEDCTPEKLYHEVDKMLYGDTSELMLKFEQMHKNIRCNADEQAANAVLALIDRA
ncbi:lipid-A-disaccharide synthase [Photobacterium angustum]|uniref:lipid-A-disaccharide synthase n=1 Tax=Photobacterium angustum TaxID=661 RepID=UPI0005E50A3F|nr:lipid-A-disaccharide synthase [Photobacterium angustum]KJF93010.1 lipid-A-disaccharide synthase [Photobacterium angustum]KJG15418.1 lipid-A-disaccharide synthase [Photobacterium angustum]KJG20593.1 lipid-A-disaccharide synthase [Photobacterium angustum]KJG27532.1 lipid-A-disaccharide synthase [Photobacterium angustum]PSV88930.1 lipid-A-disaccharide synthase [Photobacterium angustum]